MHQRGAFFLVQALFEVVPLKISMRVTRAYLLQGEVNMR